MKRDGYWTRSDQEKTDTFAGHLVFIPHIREMCPEGKEAIFGRRESTEDQTIETTRLKAK